MNIRLYALLLLMVWHAKGIAQKFDLVIRAKGDSIACGIISEDNNELRISMKDYGHWKETSVQKSKINNFQRGVINLRDFELKPGTSHILGPRIANFSNKRNFVIWVKTLDNSTKNKGLLSDIGDSHIVISPRSNHEKLNIPFSIIEEIKLRQKGKVVRGVIFGVLTGFAIGGLIGLADGNDKGQDCNGFAVNCYTAGEKALAGGTLLSIPGAIIGGITSSVKIKIPIDGNARNQKEKLLKYKLSN